MLFTACQRDDAPPKGPITFNKHVAPVVFTRCAPCHRPGQSAPFPLLSYSDAKKHARQIAELTARRAMPPWLPDGAHGEFIDDRRLTEREIDLPQRWVAGGTLEGQASDLPAAAVFPSEWPLGTPDLVVTLAEEFKLPADGPNLYRNFVLPLGVKEKRWVRAVDFRSGSAAIHHAMMAFDRTGRARQWDARDPEPGFAGFNMPAEAETPPHFLGWHPGKRPSEAPPGLSWLLQGGSDLLLQLHLRPTGKPESVAPRVAFYFTAAPPTNEPIKVAIGPLGIAIPPGASNHAVRGSYAITGDCDLLGLEPHAHFLAREVTGTAVFPDGTRRRLLHAADWNFDWQDSFHYAKPVFLPAGTTLEMEWIYDNSAANPRNPHTPPQLVRYGLESSDEMAVLSFQVLPRNAKAAQSIQDGLMKDTLRHNREYNTWLLERDPNDSRARVGLARGLYYLGQFEQATAHLATARQLDPKDDDAALFDGIVWQTRQRPQEAKAAYEDCVRLNPNNARGHGCLAVLSMQQGWFEIAEPHLREAMRIDPTDTDAPNLLQQVLKAMGRAK